uniref:Uncharacterized protein n=1 Tax=Rhizophora mucronata TaxID=61149 RepID=A0A2P2JPT4_RHIMU
MLETGKSGWLEIIETSDQ